MLIDQRYDPPIITITEDEGEELLRITERKICEVTESVERERATLGRVTHKSVEWLTTLKLLPEQLND
jgi:hypothetical protein